MDLKQIRVRIMCEAYDLADRGDSEGYNAIKVMCSDVLKLIGKQWVGLTDDEVSEIIDREIGFNSCWGPEEAFVRAVEAKLKEKNT